MVYFTWMLSSLKFSNLLHLHKTKSASSSNRVRIMNMIFASYFGEAFAFIPFFFVIIFVIAAYAILKFSGILFLACGFIGLIYMSMIIYYLGAVFSDSTKLAKLG